MRTSKVSIISIQFKNIKDPCTALTARGVISSLKGANVSDCSIYSNCGTYAGYWKHYRAKTVFCQPCKKAYSKYQKQRYQKDPKKFILKSAIWTAENRDKSNDAKKKWLENNKEKHAKSVSNWQSNNKEKVNEIGRNWAKSNIDKIRRKNHRRRATKKNVISEIYTEQQIIEKYGKYCHICSELIDFNAPRNPGKDKWEKALHIDHLIPISKGGPDTLENVRPSHAICNLRKGAKNE
jgi:hypothetical protein